MLTVDSIYAETHIAPFQGTLTELFAELKELALDSFDLKINNKRYSLLDLQQRMDKQAVIVEKCKHAQKASFVCDGNGNPVMLNGERQLDMSRTTPERAARLDALRNAYNERSDDEFSAFGEYMEKRDFFGNFIEEIEEIAPAVTIGNINDNADVCRLAEKMAK